MNIGELIHQIEVVPDTLPIPGTLPMPVPEREPATEPLREPAHT